MRWHHVRARIGVVEGRHRGVGADLRRREDESRGQEITPDRIGFDYETIRGLLPEDGKLVEKGVIPRNYVGFALGYEVKADGRRVVVRSKLGSPGVVLGEGYIKLHLGVHVVQEPLGGGPPLAFNIVAGVILTVDDQLEVTLKVPDDELRIEGDNWGGKAVAALEREELRRIVRREIEKHAEPLTELLRGRKLHPKLKAISISPAGIEIARSRPEPPKAAEAIVEAELHFHTTSDDREGGVVKVEFYSNEATKFAEVGPLPEKPGWGKGDRRTISHKIPDTDPAAGSGRIRADQPDRGGGGRYRVELRGDLDTEDGSRAVHRVRGQGPAPGCSRQAKTQARSPGHPASSVITECVRRGDRLGSRTPPRWSSSTGPPSTAAPGVAGRGPRRATRTRLPSPPGEARPHAYHARYARRTARRTSTVGLSSSTNSAPSPHQVEATTTLGAGRDVADPQPHQQVTRPVYVQYILDRSLIP